jgi:hypothetical protein
MAHLEADGGVHTITVTHAPPSAEDGCSRHAHQRQPDLSDQEGSACNGHFGCTCYHPLFLFNHLGDLERCRLRPKGLIIEREGNICFQKPATSDIIRAYFGGHLGIWN